MPNPYFNSGYGYNPYMMANTSYGNPYVGQPNYAYYSGQPQQTQQQQQQTGIIRWINSEKDVADEYVAPNGAVALWNANEPVIYLKQADATGKPSVKIFDLVERIPAEKSEEDKADFAKNSDLNALAGIVKTMNDNFTTFSQAFGELKTDLDTMKNDMYGIAGKKKTVRKSEAEEDG